MRKMKKMMSLTMAAVMTLSLAGCGGGGTAPTTKAAEPAETKAETTAEAKAEETAAAQPAGEKTTITFINGFTGGDGRRSLRISLTGRQKFRRRTWHTSG